ncbi:MAG: Lpg1974 family pore-forming outer membrane protein [Parachlamydiales bacterium]|jgi:hypothetical protein
MNILKKIFPILLGTLAISSANADVDNCAPVNDKCSTACEPCAPCCEIPKAPKIQGYNQNARISVCCTNDLYATATFLWIQPIQEQMDFALRKFNMPSGNINTLYNQNFEWKPAFKAGLGYHFNYDNWDSFIEYTRINSCMNSIVNLGDSGGFLNDFWSLQGVTGVYFTNFSEAKSKWNLDFNVFDFNFGRTYYNGTKLKFKAHYGLKVGWINQKEKAESNFPADPFNLFVTAKFKSESWLIGPRAGICSDWDLCKNFRFFGNGAISIFYQKFYRITDREVNKLLLGDGLWAMAADYSNSMINSSLEGIIGFGYGSYFDRNKWHIDLAIGYEMQLFFNQNMMRYLQQTQNDVLLGQQSVKIVSKAGNLMFHGLNITAKIEF